MDSPATPFLLSPRSCLRTSAATFLPIAGEVVTSMAEASSSCSAWPRRSAAIQEASPVPSFIMSISLGPATMSMSTAPNTRRFAVATYTFPGPTILSTRGMLRVPYASAPTAWAPPAAKTLSTPATRAAAST